MKKKSFLTVGVLLVYCTCFAQQSLTEDGKGESSLIFPSAALTINTTDPKVTVSYYYGAPRLNLYLNSARLKINQDYSVADSVFIRKCGLLGGGAVSGKNEEGVAALFKDGKFTPGGEFSAVFGGSFSVASSTVRASYRRYEDNKDLGTKERVKRDNEKALLLQYVQSINNYVKKPSTTIGTALKTQGLDVDMRAALDTFLNERPDKEIILRDFLRDKIIPKLGAISPGIADGFAVPFESVVRAAVQSISNLLQYETNVNAYNGIVSANISSVDDYLRHTLVLFGNGKYMVKGFTQYLPDSAIGKNFLDTTAHNGYLRFHANYILRDRRIGSFNINYHIFGISLGHNWLDNFDALKPLSIQHEQVLYKDSTTSGKTSKTKDAKKGNFFYYRNMNFDFDYLAIRNFDEFSLLINPYVRSTFALTAKDSMAKSTLTDPKGDYRYRKGSCTIGTGLYFASPKNIFIGGVYFEYAALPLQKPEIDKDGNDNLSTGDRFKRNFNFGLVVKINFFKFRYDKMFTDLN